MIPIEHILVLASALFCVGLLGAIFRRNLLFVLLSIEIMFNAAGFAFIGAAAHQTNVDGQVMFILILATAAAEVAIGLALLLLYEKRWKTLDIDAACELRG